MTLNTLKYNHLTPLGLKRLSNCTVPLSLIWVPEAEVSAQSVFWPDGVTGI